MTAQTADKLFTPFAHHRLRLANRVAVAPMTRISATPEGLATDGMANYYARFARGGFGLVITEGIYTDQLHSQGYACQPGLSDDEQARAWQPAVAAVHRQGGLLFAQLMHSGALSQFNRFRSEAIAPSPIRPRGQQLGLYRGNGPYSMPRSMTEGDIAQAVEGFAAAARRAREVAGFDGIEIHGANGYLLDQFLTSTTNQRTDRYGGRTASRVALIVDVATAVRHAVGADFPVGVRISQGKVNESAHKWADGEADAAVIFGRLNDCDLDYVHVTEFEAWRSAFASADTYLAAFARRFAPRLAVIANGQLHDPVRAQALLSDGAADIISIGKGALANPDWALRVRAGLPLVAFDPQMLAPLADLRDFEVAPL
jgi:2,4-dienoyl-CoA reductase-like NADH-dependent reductase (Old Yellow Enzyme family)